MKTENTEVIQSQEIPLLAIENRKELSTIKKSHVMITDWESFGI